MAAPAIEIAGLRKTFPLPGEGGAEVEIVNIPVFSLETGSQTALAGESGSGKTTFLNLISGILMPESGSIRVAGTDITALSEAARDRHRARHTGYVFQSFNLLQGYSALENVTLASSLAGTADPGRARELLDRVGLGGKLRHRPRELSAGQQQRVAVARALINRPAVVLADEPTGSLDARNAAAVLDLLQTLCREEDAALLLVSHDPKVTGAFGTVIAFSELNRASGSRNIQGGNAA